MVNNTTLPLSNSLKARFAILAYSFGKKKNNRMRGSLVPLSISDVYFEKYVVK